MRASKLFWIGLTISFSIVIFVFGLLYLQDISLNKASLRFTVMFDNVQGLNDGDTVNMLGKRIGKVSTTKIRGNRIAVEVSIDQNFAFDIPVDSRIEVKSDGLMGAKFVAIEPGNNTKVSIADGDVVEGTREVDFTEITPGIMPITQDLAVFSRRLKAILGESQKDDVRNTLSNVESLTGELDSLIKDIHYILINDDDRKNISDFFEKLNSTGKNLDEMTKNRKDDISKIIDNLSKGSETFSKSADKLSKLIDGVDKIIDDVDSGNGSLGKLVKNDNLVENLNGFIDDLRLLVEDFNENTEEYLKKYIRASKKVKKEK